MDVEVRSVSARTVLATVKAMADSAAESQSTISSADPLVLVGRSPWTAPDARVRLLGIGNNLTRPDQGVGPRARAPAPLEPTLILIRLHRQPCHPNRNRQRDWLQPRRIRNQRRHLHAYSARQRRPGP